MNDRIRPAARPVLERAIEGGPRAIDNFDGDQSAANDVRDLAPDSFEAWVSTITPDEAEAVLETLDQIAEQHRRRSVRAEALSEDIRARFARVNSYGRDAPMRGDTVAMKPAG